MKMYGFEVPNAFGSFIARLTRPPRMGSVEARPVQQAIAAPRTPFYNPDDLNFPNAQGPIVRGNGGHHTMGIEMVAYDHQPMWDRNATAEAGPIRAFMRGVVADRRIKQT